MQICTNVIIEALSGTFIAISGGGEGGGGWGGGKIYKMMLHVNVATLRRLAYFSLCLI